MKKLLLLAAAIFVVMLACAPEPERPRCNHEWGEWQTEKTATCAEEGLRIRPCLHCYSWDDEIIEKLTNHSWGAWEITKPATCEAEGTRRQTCTRCGSLNNGTIPKLTGSQCGGGGGNQGAVIKPSSWNISQIQTRYDNYRREHLAAPTPSGNRYIKAGGTNYGGQIVTQSEAHGYGMMIFALMANTSMARGDERAIFDGMNQMRRGHPSSSQGAGHLMSWVVFSGHENNTLPSQTPAPQWPDTSPGRRSSATDGDFDMAYALLLAQKVWGGDYEEQAKLIINQLRQLCMGPNSKRTLLGDWARNSWTQTGTNPDPQSLNTRSSDWMPGHFRAFHRATGDVFWLDAIDTIYALLGQVSNRETGLMPDFVTGRPAVADPKGGGTTGENNQVHYANNACRVPWRLATHWVHYEDQRAKTQIDKISTWLRGATNGNPTIEANRIRHGYHLDGKPLDPNSWGAMHFVAPFAAGMIADPANQQFLNNTWTWMMNNNPRDAYQAAIQLLCMLLITGHWQAP